MTKVDIAGLKIDALTKGELLEVLRQRIKSGQKTWLTTPYSEFLRTGLLDPEVMRILNSADLAVPDGIGLFWAARYLSIPLTAKSYWGKIIQAAWQIKYSLAAIIFYPRWIKSGLSASAKATADASQNKINKCEAEKISGSDLVWDLAKFAADNNLSIYLLGGFDDTAQLAASRLKEQGIKNCGRSLLYPNFQFDVLYSNKNPNDPTIVNDIKKAAPDILLVAYGPIKQERWINSNLPNLPVHPVKSGEAGSSETKFNGVKLVVGLGGTFDYLAGKRPNPPKFMRAMGLEWLWRLFTQPWRIKRIWNATFGLAISLWRYKVFMSLPMRKNVAIVILNSQNQILVCQRNPKNFHVDIISTKDNLKRINYWQFPQGGIDAGEDVIKAALREAAEEIGVKNLSLIKISEKINTYMWNNAARGFWHNRRHQNPGQNQQVAFFRFTGPESEIKTDDHEFISYKWVSIGELQNTIHPERINLVKIIGQDLKEMQEKAII